MTNCREFHTDNALTSVSLIKNFVWQKQQWMKSQTDGGMNATERKKDATVNLFSRYSSISFSQLCSTKQEALYNRMLDQVKACPEYYILLKYIYNYKHIYKYIYNIFIIVKYIYL